MGRQACGEMWGAGAPKPRPVATDEDLQAQAWLPSCLTALLAEARVPASALTQLWSPALCTCSVSIIECTWLAPGMRHSCAVALEALELLTSACPACWNSFAGSIQLAHLIPLFVTSCVLHSRRTRLRRRRWHGMRTSLRSPRPPARWRRAAAAGARATRCLSTPSRAAAAAATFRYPPVRRAAPDA